MKKRSINLVDEPMLPQADYVDSASDSKEDKSKVFAYEQGEAGEPIIKEGPLTLECSVVDIYETPNFERFICTIDNTYAAGEHHRIAAEQKRGRKRNAKGITGTYQCKKGRDHQRLRETISNKKL